MFAECEVFVQFNMIEIKLSVCVRGHHALLVKIEKGLCIIDTRCLSASNTDLDQFGTLE